MNLLIIIEDNVAPNSPFVRGDIKDSVVLDCAYDNAHVFPEKQITCR